MLEDPARNPEYSSWFMGCVNSSSSRLRVSEGVRDLDPVICCSRCLNEGYQVAALNSEGCYCGNQEHGLVVSECFGAPSKKGANGVRRESQGHNLLLPVGGEHGSLAIYKTGGPFLRSVHLSASPDRVQAGETFILEVSGNLAGPPYKPTGILGLGGLDLSYITVQIQEMTHKGQSLHRVSVTEQGSFFVSTPWMLETPATHEFNVTVSNPLSTLSSSLHVIVLQPPPHSLLLSLLHGPLGLPSCVPLQVHDSHSGRTEAVYLGDPVTLQAHVGEGLAAGFSWWFTRDGNEKSKTAVRTDCLPVSECENSTVLVVCPAVSDLRVSVPPSPMISGEIFILNVDLSTTMKHLLLLNLTLNVKNNSMTTTNIQSFNTDDFKWDFENSHNDTCKMSHTEIRSNKMSHQESASAHSLSRNRDKISCHGGTNLYPLSDTRLHSSNSSSCRLHLNFLCRLPASAARSHSSSVAVTVLVNSTLLHRRSRYHTQEETVEVLLFHHSGTVAAELRAEHRASSQNRSVIVSVKRNRKSSPQVTVNPLWHPPTSQKPVHSLPDNVRIYAEKQVHPTHTNITFLAVAEVPDPVEFLWHFGDSRSARTTSRTITKRYHKPGSFDVVVVMTRGRTSVTSDVFPLVVQRAVKLSRLLHQVSALQNHTVMLSCRLSAGTDVSFLWDFGDGSSRLGESTEQHIFHRTGEFTVTVTVSNLVSSASLSSLIFIVDQPCRPPPVKNMGPLKLQVQRYEEIHVGVTYETEIHCDISGGLNYTWTLFGSAGQVLPLPLIDTHRQSLMLPGYFLDVGTYTAVARVQIVGSVVHSNYSVRVQVMPSPPVAIIQGGTNVFINSRDSTMVTLDGQRSYDPDFPKNPVSFSWTCRPVSSIPSSCFHQDVPSSSSVFRFPVSSLKQNFDQFRFTLTVHSGERSASSETFLTLTSNVIRKVSMHCPQCQGDQVKWDQSFFVSAECQDCDVAPESIQYTWSLYSVNASSRPAAEVPFCHAVYLSAPSTILQAPTASTQHLPVDTSAPVSLAASASANRAEKQNPNVTDSGTLSRNNRKKSSVPGEEPFYHPLGEFDPPEPLYSPTEYQLLALDNSSVLYSDHFYQSDIISEFPIDPDSSADWEFSFPALERDEMEVGPDLDYDVDLMGVEEGEPGISAGRPTDEDGDTFSPGEDSVFDPELREDEGSNLMGSRPSVVTQEPNLLDLSRELVNRDLFESFTDTGIISSLLRFRPFSLRPGSRYMLMVTAKSPDGFLGRTQLFFKTNPAPNGMMCQVQPTRGAELYTHFSIFCTSGKEDLWYKYSVDVGDQPPRMLYQGRDFQYYFSLPSGDPSHDYKVTVYTEIRSSMYGTATKPCPVTVQVLPSFVRKTSSQLDPDLDLSTTGLRNLSALVQLGNSMEIHNYVSLLSGVLNRLSLDTDGNTAAQKCTRSVLICTMCELESMEQASLVDNINILKSLLQVTHQVTLASARQATRHVVAISGRFPDSRAPVWYHLDQNTLQSLVALLSHSLQVVLTDTNSSAEPSNVADIKQAFESDSRNDNSKTSFKSCRPESMRGGRKQLSADILQAASQLMQKYMLFHEVQEHRVSTDLITLYATYQNQTSKDISSGSAAFHLPDSLIQLLLLHRSRETKSRPQKSCVLRLLTELSHNPFTWAPHPGKKSGPVVDLSLYECSTRRRIPVRSLPHPVNIQLQPVARNQSSVHPYTLQRSQVNYHSFNITQEHLQQAVQLSVVFTPSVHRAFPVLLLFRMFEKPTPSMHHLQTTHRWESSIIRLTLPTSSLSAPGVGHLALLNADFGKMPRHKHFSEQVSYSLTADSSLCLSWDDHQGAWTHHGCRTQYTDSTATVNCSCHRLRPLTVVQQQIQSSHDVASLDPFLRVPSDLTVLGVLILSLCLYIPALVLGRRADVISEMKQRVHYLADNSTYDRHVYAVTVHTGPRSAACMTAKVYIVLFGEDGVSQTRELQAPGCTLFGRNSRDTFILSAADSLGAVWGVHIWHDNSGACPHWFLKHVEVSEVSRGQVKGHSWLFVGQCWLAVSEGDGRVERTLRVCTGGLGFAEMLRLKMSDFLLDHHLWMSVRSCPCPHSFTHTQRLGVSLLLLLGYACVNSVLVSQADDHVSNQISCSSVLREISITLLIHIPPLQLVCETGSIDLSAVSVTTGVLSVVVVLPAAVMISLLFRMREVKLTRSGVQQDKAVKTEKDDLSVTDSVSDLHLSWSGIQRWTQESRRKKSQDSDLPPASTLTAENKGTYFHTDMAIIKEDAQTAESSIIPALIAEQNYVDPAHEGKESHHFSGSDRFPGNQEACLAETTDGNQGKRKEGNRYQAAVSARSDSYVCGHSVKRGMLTSVSQWCHYVAWMLCLLLSVSCVLLSVVLGSRFSSCEVLLWTHSLFFSLISCIFLIQPAVIFGAAVIVSLWYSKRADFHSFCSTRQFEKEAVEQHKADCFSDWQLLVARGRARYLCFIRPPTLAELRKTRGRKRRETLLHNTLRDLFICCSSLLLMLFISCGSSLTDPYHLNKAVRKHFIRGHDSFMSIQQHEDWWKWTRTSLIDLLYNNASASPERPHILIGEPALWKTEGQAADVTLVPDCLQLFLLRSRTSSHSQPTASPAQVMSPRTCGRLGCYEPSTTLSLGHTKSDAAFKLKRLHSDGWLDRHTVAVGVKFTVFSPAPNLFTGVTVLVEQSPTGVLLPSAKVHSVRVYHTPSELDYVVMVCQLLFLLLSLLQLCDQVTAVDQQGMRGYWKTNRNWLEVSLLIVTLLYFIHYIHHSSIIVEVMELLQRHSHRPHVDVGLLATWEQHIRSLRGVILFLLTVKCVTVLKMNRMLATCATALTCSFSSLFWPTVSGIILMVALSCMGNLLFVENLGSFSSSSHSLLRTLLHHCRGPKHVRGLHFSWSDFLYRGVLCLCSTVLWTAVVTGAVSSLVKRLKRSLSKGSVFTAAELVSYIRHKVSDFTGRRKEWMENYVAGKTYYFEEFESLLDELLFRLNALSNSLHHTLPSNSHRYREEDSPVISATQEPSNIDTQDFFATQLTEDPRISNHTAVNSHGETLPASHLLWSKLEPHILQFVELNGKEADDSSSDIAVAVESMQQPRTRSGVKAIDRELQPYLKTQSLSQSTSLTRVWTDDFLKKQSNQCIKINNSCTFSKSQANHTEHCRSLCKWATLIRKRYGRIANSILQRKIEWRTVIGGEQVVMTNHNVASQRSSRRRRRRA
ncbi:uncharacterized protein V6R79_005557 [Siganus canaliculatus]